MSDKIRNLIEYCQKYPKSPICRVPGGTSDPEGIPDGREALKLLLQFMSGEDVTLHSSDWYALATMLKYAGFYQDALNAAKVAEAQIEGANYLAHAQSLQVQGAALRNLNNSEASTIALDMAERLLNTARLQNHLEGSLHKSLP